MRSDIVTSLFLFSVIFSNIYCCPNEPTEFLIVIKAVYYLSDYQWEAVRNLVAKISTAVDLGRTDKSSQIGIYLFDNTNDPVPIIPLGSYGRSSDLAIAVEKLKLLPCGTWCTNENQKGDAEQITKILSNQPFTRPAKIFIVTTQLLDSYSLQTITGTSSNMVVQQVMIPQTPGIVTYGSPYYDYYRAYYDTYRRYSERMGQLYPYMTIEIPPDQYPFIQQNDRYGNYDYDSWAGSTCYSLIGCQECLTVTPKIAPSVDSTPTEIETVHSGDSNNNEHIIIDSKLTTETVSVTKAPETKTENADYEYEITADPPGMKINKTPLLDEVKEKSVSDEDLI